MKRRFLLLVGCFVCISAFAQDASQANAKILTFEEAIRIALRNNILLNTARNNFEAAQALKLSGIMSLGPNVNASLQASRFSGNSFNQQVGGVVIGVRDNVNGSINANIQVFNGFSAINYMRAQNENLDAATYFVQRTTQDVMNNVATQYLNVLVDIELLEIAQKNYEAQAKLLEQVTEQLNVGARSQVDQYNQDALTKGAEYRAVLAQVQLDNDRALLAQTLLIDAVSQPFEVEKPVWEPGAMIDRNLSVDSLVAQAKTHRADYLRAIKLEDAARHNAASVLGNSLPSVTAFAGIGSNYNYQHNVQKYEDDGVTIRKQWEENETPFSSQFRVNNVQRNIGLQLNVPILNGFRNRAQYIQSRISFRNAELTHRNLDVQLRNDVLRAVRTYEGSRKAYVVSLDQLKAAENAFTFETERFNLGVTNFVDYTNANRVLVQAQTDKAQAEYRLVFQKILIDYAVGTLRPEDVVGQ
ncbi:MAG TPA: TolC family protein [Cyclobacteriaceae bacterium]|nr:TolC family protein [Cyclobacteriaceae bacterium]